MTDVFSVGDMVETTDLFEIDYRDCLSYDERRSAIKTEFHIPPGSRGVVVSPRNDINGNIRQAVRFENAPNWRCLYYSNAHMGIEEHEIGPGHYIPVSMLQIVESWEVNGLPELDGLLP